VRWHVQALHRARDRVALLAVQAHEVLDAEQHARARVRPEEAEARLDELRRLLLQLRFVLRAAEPTSNSAREKFSSLHCGSQNRTL